MINRCAAYPSILSHLRPNPNPEFLEIGCFMGQDLRRLSADLYKNDSAATTPKQLYGSDVLDGIWEVGFDMFQDRKKFNADFMIANILNIEALALAPLRGTFDVVYVCHVMHLFE